MTVSPITVKPLSVFQLFQCGGKCCFITVTGDDETTSKAVTTTKATAVTTTKNPVTTTQEHTTEKPAGRTVYRAPEGKRYHFDPDCPGKNGYATTIDEAIRAGLLPAKNALSKFTIK